ncbi:MAG: SigE family RNA polymerase sigma factor [Acidimicrobiia bacterium]
MTAQREKTSAETPTNEFRAGFDNFYRRELPAVVGLAYVLSGSRSGAEDLAQEGFIAALKRWDQIGRYDDPGAWVRRVVANRAVSRFRRRAAEARALTRLGRPDYRVPDLTPEGVATWEAVRRLPKRQAQVIALRYLDGRKVSDIAEILGCSEATVKTHLQRAKHTLAQQLGEEPDHEHL